MNWPQVLLMGFLAGAAIGGGYLVITDLIAMKRTIDKEIDDRIYGDKAGRDKR